MSNIIELKSVNYTYGAGTPFEMRALQDVNITIRRGSVTGIIGHTGSGKSTLVQLLNGLIRPESGQGLLGERDIWEKPKEIRSVRFRVGLVMQYPEEYYSVATNIKTDAFRFGISKCEIVKLPTLGKQNHSCNQYRDSNQAQLLYGY